MPTYEYECAKCGHEFEREQRITDEPVKKCPACRASQVRRLISATSFVLKGGGWYSDLYASSKGKAESSDKGPDKAESKGTSDSGKSETQPTAAEKPASGKKASKAKPTAAA